MTTTRPTRTPHRRRAASAALSIALATAGLAALAPPAAASDAVRIATGDGQGGGGQGGDGQGGDRGPIITV